MSNSSFAYAPQIVRKAEPHFGSLGGGNNQVELQHSSTWVRKCYQFSHKLPVWSKSLDTFLFVCPLSLDAKYFILTVFTGIRIDTKVHLRVESSELRGIVVPLLWHSKLEELPKKKKKLSIHFFILSPLNYLSSSSCAGVHVLEVETGIYEGKTHSSSSVLWSDMEMGTQWCKVRELKSQTETLILVLKFPLTFENACSKEALGFELNPPNHL